MGEEKKGNNDKYMHNYAEATFITLVYLSL